MYPPGFAEWVRSNGYYPIGEIWYVWHDDEIMETPIADNTDELYEYWKEKTGYVENIAG